MCSGAGHTTWLVRGSPIRTPSDQRSVGSSPRLIAASHVLHRLLVPRHPPCALNNLTTTNKPTHEQTLHNPTPHDDQQTTGNTGPRSVKKMLASTVQFSTTHQPPPHHPARPGIDTKRRRRRDESGTALTRETHPPAPVAPPPHGGRAPDSAGSAPSGPNSVPTATTPTPAPLHTPPPPPHGRKTAGRTGSRPSDRRPNWSAFHPRAPAGRLRPPTAGGRPHPARPLAPPPPGQPRARRACRCSLERR